MDIALGIAMYFVLWWLTLFAILPLWVKTQIDEGTMVAGTASSAPVAANMLKKLLITTVVSASVYALIYVLIHFDIVTTRSIPFLPHFDGQYQ